MGNSSNRNERWTKAFVTDALYLIKFSVWFFTTPAPVKSPKHNIVTTTPHMPLQDGWCVWICWLSNTIISTVVSTKHMYSGWWNVNWSLRHCIMYLRPLYHELFISESSFQFACTLDFQWRWSNSSVLPGIFDFYHFLQSASYLKRCLTS